VLETARALGESRAVGVDATGRLTVDAVVDASRDGVSLVSVGLANGEIGVVAPIAALAERLRPTGTVLHTDAAQAAGRLPIDVATLGVDALSLSSHKLGGPLGVGALWLRPGQRLTPQLSGGPQERERRAGTENVPALVGFGAAATAARQHLDAECAAMRRRRDRLWEHLRATVPHLVLNGPDDEPRLPNTLNVSFEGCAGESVLVRLDLAGVAVSLGSACAAGAAAPSHVLLAMGRDLDAARSGIRISLGPSTTDAEIDHAARLAADAVAAVRRRVAA
jgi:cysteine desulfurase